MEWVALSVFFEHEDKELASELIADAFIRIGLKGVEILDPDLEPDESWSRDAIPKPNRHAVVGYFPDTRQTIEKLAQLENQFQQLESAHGIIVAKKFRRLNEEDWAESWKDFFWPQRITPRITVKPTWREYHPRQDEIVLEVDPSMAFGTGTHPTTVLCIALMEKYLMQGSSFLDVGTGSGILMSAAAKLGAKQLIGIDNDELAVKVAAENLALNGVDDHCFQLMATNLVDGVKGVYDIIVANILSKAIIQLLDDIHRVMSGDSCLICSGIYEDNCDQVLEKMVKMGFNVLDRRKKESWVAIACAR